MKNNFQMNLIRAICFLSFLFYLNSCDIEGYDYRVVFKNETNSYLLIYIKESYPDTLLKAEEIETIIDGSFRNDSSYFCSEIINPHSDHLIDSYCYSNAWPMKGKKRKLIIYVFDRLKMKHARKTNQEIVKSSLMRMLILSFDDVSKDNYKVHFY